MATKTETLIEETAEVIALPRKIDPLRATRFNAPGAVRNEWVATLPSDTPWGAIHEPGFWRIIVQRLRIGDVIEIRSDDLTCWGLVLVAFVESSTGMITLSEIIHREFEKPIVTPDATGQFYPHYTGLQDGWAVIRSEDGATMAKGIRSQQEARSRIATEFSKPARPTFG
jgi:hypothetical protein